MSSEAPPGDREATIWEHVQELLIRLRRIVIAFFVAAMILSFLPAPPSRATNVHGFTDLLKEAFLSYSPLALKLPELIFSHVIPPKVTAFDGKTYTIQVLSTSAFESINVLAMSVVLLGLIGASPVIAKEIWEYIEPALYPHEKAFAKKYLVLFIVAFLFGVFFGIYIVAPLVMLLVLKLRPLYVPPQYKLILNVSVSETVEFALKLALAFGGLFELPVVLYLLLAYGILDPDLFNEQTMKYIFLGTMLIGAIISPDPSGIGMLAIGFSLYIPIHIAVKLGKKKAMERKILEEIKALAEA